MRQDFGYPTGCVWVLAISADGARRRGESVLRSTLPTPPPVDLIDAFRRSEYPDRAGPQDFTADVRLDRTVTVR